MLQTLIYNLGYYIPEIILIALMCVLLFIEASYSAKSSRRYAVFATAITGMLIAFFVQLSFIGKAPVSIFSGSIVVDPISSLVKLLMIGGAILAGVLAITSKDIYAELKSEFFITTIAVLIGGMLLASANNMITMYLGIETLSIVSYVLASFKRNDSNSAEAGMKYALYGGISAGIMLFGMSYIYGVFGSIQFNEIALKIATVPEQLNWVVLAAFILFFSGLGYKVAAFPFHMWSPDVYQGSPIPVTLYFAIVPKFAGIVAIMRVTEIFFAKESALSTSWVSIIQLIAIMTMFVGNITAIGQDSVKRLLAFSSIGHVGFILLGASMVNVIGHSSILYYLVAYIFMTVVAFYVVSIVADQYDTDSQSVFRGLIYKDPVIAIFFAIALFSLAGMPPFSGFVAKFNILAVIIEKKYYGVAFLAAVNSVISLYYYLKLAKVALVYNPELTDGLTERSLTNKTVIVLAGIPILLLGIFWEKIYFIVSNVTFYHQQ